MLWSCSAVVEVYLSSHRMICEPVLQQEYYISHILQSWKAPPTQKHCDYFQGVWGWRLCFLCRFLLRWTEIQSQTCRTPTPVHIRKESWGNLQLVLCHIRSCCCTPGGVGIFPDGSDESKACVIERRPGEISRCFSHVRSEWVTSTSVDTTWCSL